MREHRWMPGEAGFHAYVVARRPALLRAARLLTGDPHSAEDLVQIALVALARHWDRVVSRGDPEAYVRRSLYRAHVSAWRRLRSRPVEAAAEDHERTDRPGSDPSEALAQRVTLAAALSRLTPKQRAVLVLRYYDDLTETAAAQVLGVSSGTVKSQTRHALRRLRELAPELVDLAPGGPAGMPPETLCRESPGGAGRGESPGGARRGESPGGARQSAPGAAGRGAGHQEVAR